MIKEVCTIISCALVVLLTFGSCTSEPKSDSVDVTEESEQSPQIVTLDDAIDDLEAACNAGNRDGALAAYEVVLRMLLDKTVKNTYEGDYAMSSVLTPEQEKRLEALSSCECLSDQDIQEITDRVEAEY